MNKQSAILTEQDFRDAISKQCGFPEKDERARPCFPTRYDANGNLRKIDRKRTMPSVESEEDYDERISEREQDRYEQQEQ